MQHLHSLSGPGRRQWLSTLQADLWLNLLVALFLLANPPPTSTPIEAAVTSPEAGPVEQKSAIINLRTEGWVTMKDLPPVSLTNLTLLPGLVGATNCQIHHPRNIPAGALTDLMCALRATYPHLNTLLVPDAQ